MLYRSRKTCKVALTASGGGATAAAIDAVAVVFRAPHKGMFQRQIEENWRKALTASRATPAPVRVLLSKNLPRGQLDETTSDVYTVRQLTAAVVTPTQAFNVMVTRGVNRGGASNCFAGVTVLP